MDAIKPLYRSSNLEAARLEFKKLKDSIGKVYPKVIKLLESNESLFSFYRYPKQIRSSIYTTNLVERLNKQLKRQTKKKEQFPNEDSLERFVCNYFNEYNARFGSRIHRGFGEVNMEISNMFEQKYNQD